MTPTELRVLDATKVCCERWGIAKVTIDDIAAEAGVSRATLYRMFPGGKDVLFDALRVHELEDFFTRLSAHIQDTTELEELLVRTVVYATVELRSDDHLALMLASEPGDTLSNLTVQGLPRIIRMASLFIAGKVEPYLDRANAQRLVDLLARLVISYFLAPSDHVDLGDEGSARAFHHHPRPAHLRAAGRAAGQHALTAGRPATCSAFADPSGPIGTTSGTSQEHLRSPIP